MICDNCKIERKETDFINNQKFCYKCEYQKNIEKASKNRIRKTVTCRECGKIVNHNKELKKRQRTVFCSLECAKKGHRELSNNHWTRKFRSAGVV